MKDFLSKTRNFVAVLILTVSCAAFADVLCVGNKVVTRDHYSGVVTFVYPDGTVDVRYDLDGGVRNRSITNVTLIQATIGNFAVGNRVVTVDHYPGTITFLYPDNSADVRYDLDGGIRNRSVANLTHITKQMGSFAVGQHVVTRDHYTGIITFLYPDNSADVQYDLDGGARNRSLTNLFPIVKQMGIFAVGQRIVTIDHYTGVITFLYPDNSADVQYDMDGGTRNRSLSNLYPVSSCTAYCK